MDEILKNINTHLYPKTPEEVLKLLNDPQSVILAGGTGLSLERNDLIETVIDLQNVGLDYIREDNGFFYIGAMTSAYSIFADIRLPKSLRDAAKLVGDVPVLHGVTIGGNLAKLYHWVDLPPMLWALNAEFIVYTPEKLQMHSDEFFAYSVERNIYSRKQLITEVKIPKSGKNSFSSYQSLTLTLVNKGQLNLAFQAKWNDEMLLTEVRFVLYGATNNPMRLTEVENALNGKHVNSALELTENLDLSKITLKSDYKSSVEYRLHILRVYIKRALMEMKEASRGA